MNNEDYLNEARGWLADCAWADMNPDEFAEMSAARVRRGIERHYEGGWEAFIKASTATPAPAPLAAAMKLEFLNVCGTVLTTRRMPLQDIGELEESIRRYTFPFNEKVHAVRVNWRTGQKLVRRHLNAVAAYGPGSLPVRRTA